jgi:hypothetical protein
VVDTTGSKTALDNLKAASFAEDEVGDGDAHIFETDVTVSVGGVVVAKDVHHAVDCDAWCAGGDDDDGLLAVGVWVLRVGFAHDEVELAARVACSRGPPFLPINQ